MSADYSEQDSLLTTNLPKSRGKKNRPSGNNRLLIYGGAKYKERRQVR